MFVGTIWFTCSTQLIDESRQIVLRGCSLCCQVDGLDFLAMSMHYYAVDCMRALLPPTSSGALRDRWPQPSISDILRATLDWCQIEWSQLSTGQLGTHEFTAPDKLPHRCCALLLFQIALLYGRDTNR